MVWMRFDVEVDVCAAGDGCDHVVLTKTTAPALSANSSNSNAPSLSLLHSALIESQPRSAVLAKRTYASDATFAQLS